MERNFIVEKCLEVNDFYLGRQRNYAVAEQRYDPFKRKRSVCVSINDGIVGMFLLIQLHAPQQYVPDAVTHKQVTADDPEYFFALKSSIDGQRVENHRFICEVY